VLQAFDLPSTTPISKLNLGYGHGFILLIRFGDRLTHLRPKPRPLAPHMAALAFFPHRGHILDCLSTALADQRPIVVHHSEPLHPVSL